VHLTPFNTEFQPHSFVHFVRISLKLLFTRPVVSFNHLNPAERARDGEETVEFYNDRLHNAQNVEVANKVGIIIIIIIITARRRLNLFVYV